MTFGIMQHLSVAVCKDADDAIQQGFNYRAPDYKAIEIEKVVVVENGTVGGNKTVDIILKDETGQKFVVMLTGNLLKTVAATL